MIDVIVPTIGRADRLASVAANIAAATTVPHRIVFVLEEKDDASIVAVDALDLEPVINNRSHNYAGAATAGYEATSSPYVFAGADDLRFHSGWAEAALDVMGAAGRVEVVGTNDLLNPFVLNGLHATHYLVAREYLDRDGGVVDQGPGSFLCELYDHQYTDTEFIGTAKWRTRFMPCLDSIVEHMHFLVGKSAPDETYERAYRHAEDDSALYDERRELWFSLSR